MQKRNETRLTVVNGAKDGEQGRVFEIWDVEIYESIQDEGRTLKIFLK